MNWLQIRQCCRKMMSGRSVAGAFSSLVNARGLIASVC